MTNPSDALIVMTTAGSAEEAAKIARSLVEERLAACVNVVPAIRSFYRWQGEIVDEAEVLLVVKSSRARFAALEQRICELHSYDVPEVLAIDVAAGSARYLDWLVAALTDA